jgi:hypothetical protein
MLLADHDRRAPTPAIALITCAARQSARGRGELASTSSQMLYPQEPGPTATPGAFATGGTRLVGALPAQLAPAVR